MAVGTQLPVVGGKLTADSGVGTNLRPPEAGCPIPPLATPFRGGEQHAAVRPPPPPTRPTLPDSY